MRKLYHGTRTCFGPGETIAPRPGEDFVRLTADLDAAIWSAELADGEDAPRVFEVALTGALEPPSNEALPPHPAMGSCSRAPLTVLREVSQWAYYHGTRASLAVGDLIVPGHLANHGRVARVAKHVYFSRTLDAAIWGAELATGDAAPRVYVVEPTGDFEDDPNLTNAKFRGNPSKSFRSRAPVRVREEVAHWTGHPRASLDEMRARLAQLARAGIEADDG